MALCDPSGTRDITSFDQLTTGDYERTPHNPGAWNRLNTKLDRTLFCQRLELIRDVRNDITHFKPEDIPANAVDVLRNLLRMVRLDLPV